jgi:hypothetical protein
MIEKDTIAVFTARSPGRIIEEGGSQAWVLNPTRAKLCKWLVCTQNRYNPDHEFSDPTEPHGAAFLVGKISGIIQSAEHGAKDRWMIEISEAARINVPDVWKRWRNPVRYVSLAELGIGVDGLEFTAVSGKERASLQQSNGTSWPPMTLTIAEAKKALAATFGVEPEAVEITIRG